jgi:hypothetical protein
VHIANLARHLISLSHVVCFERPLRGNEFNALADRSWPEVAGLASGKRPPTVARRNGGRPTELDPVWPFVEAMGKKLATALADASSIAPRLRTRIGRPRDNALHVLLDER